MAIGCVLALAAALAAAGCGADKRLGGSGASGTARRSSRQPTATGAGSGVAARSSPAVVRRFAFGGDAADAWETALRPSAEEDGSGFGMARDERLDRAAGEVAEMAARDLPVSATAVTEALWWNGVPETSFQAAVFERGDSAGIAADVRSWLKERSSQGADRFGLAEVKIENGLAAAVIAGASRVRLDAVPRRLAARKTIRIAGRVDPPFQAVEVVAAGPHGQIERPKVDGKRGAFASDCDLDDTGIWQLEIVADSPQGPTALANFPVAVGVDAPREIALPDLDLESRAPEELARLLFDHLAKERKERDLPPLAWSDALADVARRYSEEMRRSGVVAHVSPVSGTVVDRVRAAGIRFLGVTENLAQAGSIAEAHSGLMRSPAHRANILSPQATEVGMGVAVLEAEPTPAVIVTQVFLLGLDPRWKDARGSDVVDEVNRLREQAEAASLGRNPKLARAAESLTERCFAGGDLRVDPAAMGLKRALAVAFKTNDLAAGLAGVASLEEARWTDVGAGIARGKDPATDTELFCVVVLLGQR